MRGHLGMLVLLTVAIAGCDDVAGGGACEHAVQIDFPCSGTSACIGTTRVQRCSTAFCADLGYEPGCCEGATCINGDTRDCSSGSACMERTYAGGEVEATCIRVADGGATSGVDGGWGVRVGQPTTCGIPRYWEAVDAGPDGPADAALDGGADGAGDGGAVDAGVG